MTEGEMRTALQRYGLRWTAQRRVVCQALRDRRDHPTADDVLGAVRERFPGISRATIYNTLETLVRAGLCTLLRSQDGVRRFDPNLVPHDHLVCTRCGLLADLSRRGAERRVSGRVRRDGFQVNEIRVEYRGLCRDCRLAAAPSK